MFYKPSYVFCNGCISWSLRVYKVHLAGKSFFNRWLNNGGYGVQFFVVLSGFCVCMGYGSKLKTRELKVLH